MNSGDPYRSIFTHQHSKVYTRRYTHSTHTGSGGSSSRHSSSSHSNVPATVTNVPMLFALGWLRLIGAAVMDQQQGSGFTDGTHTIRDGIHGILKKIPDRRGRQRTRQNPGPGTVHRHLQAARQHQADERRLIHTRRFRGQQQEITQEIPAGIALCIIPAKRFASHLPRSRRRRRFAAAAPRLPRRRSAASVTIHEGEC